MNAPAATADRYDSRTITLHWLTAVLVVGLWTLGETIDFFPKGAPRIAAHGGQSTADRALSGRAAGTGAC